MKKHSALQALLHSRDIVGVDLGSHCVRVLSLDARGGGLSVVGYAEKEVWRELAEARSDHEKRRVVAAALRSLLGARAFGMKGAALSLSGNGMLTRFFDSSKPYKPDPRAPIPKEAAELAPFGDAETVISSRSQPGFPVRGETPTESMVVFAPKKLVDEGAAIVRLAGLTPALVINDALALQAAYEHAYGFSRHETIALVGAGASCASVSIIENGIVRAVRVFNIAGAAFTRAIQRDLGVSYEEAEALKKRHGLSALGRAEDDQSEAARVCRALKPVVRSFGNEIVRTVDGFLDKRPPNYPPLRAVVLAGGSASMPAFLESVSVEVGVPAEAFRPLAGARVRNGRGGPDLASPSLAVACGLAVQSALRRDSTRTRYNLLSRRARRAATITTMSMSLVVAALALLLAFAGGVWYWVQATRLAEEQASIELALAAAKRARDARPRPAAQARAAAVERKRRSESPFSYLSRLELTGVMGAGGKSFAMLALGDSVFVAKSGYLYDENERPVPGVAAEMVPGKLILTTSSKERFVIALPR